MYVGIVNIIFTSISLLLIDRFGRKPLHMIGLSGMFTMAIALGVILGHFRQVDNLNIEFSKKLTKIHESDSGETVSKLSVAFVLIFVAFFQCGPGSIPWFISAELFSDSDRLGNC